MVFGFLEDRHRLVVRNIVTTTCLSQVVRHVAYSDTPIAVIVDATLVHLLSPVPTRADTNAYMSFIFLEPVRDMLNINRLVLYRDGFLHRNDVHSDTRTAHRHHWSNLLQW